MSSAQIRALLGSSNEESSQKRTLDYLNARLHSWQDLEDATDFQDGVDVSEARHNQLKDDFTQSQLHVNDVVAHTRESISEQLHTAQELSLLRHSLADELTFLSQQLVSSLAGPDGKPTLLEDVETLHRGLKELQSVKGYIQVVENALRISEGAVVLAKSPASPFDCISNYKDLQKFVLSVRQACTSIEDAAGQQTLHVVTFLTNIQDRTWNEIKGAFTGTLLVASEKLQWPMTVNYNEVTPADRKAFETAFHNLLKLQSVGTQLHPQTQERTERDGLYPIEALVQPVSLRFKYHFEGSRQTNRLDKPEWYFTHILNIAHEQRSFMDNVIQPLLSQTEYRHIVAWREFTLLLLPLLSRKLRKTIPTLISHPPILAHTIYQALAFDSSLKEEGFDLGGTSAAATEPQDKRSKAESSKWEGISEVILGEKEWFEAWMEGERAFAMDQYMSIISAADAWLIADENIEDEESPVDKELKPTNSARQVKALVEQVTDRYSPLPEFVQRTRFMITVQLPLLESYHSRISASLDAFETLSSAFMRAVPGSLGTDAGRTRDSRSLTTGVEGVQRLCKALVSAKYTSTAMESWGEDLFFLELWTEINRKAALRSRAVAASSLPDPKGSDEDVPEGTIFEELVVQYNKLVIRAEDLIVHTVIEEVEAGLKPHFTGNGASVQNTPENVPETDPIALPTSLLNPITLLSSHLTYLQGALPQTTATMLYRRIASSLALHILQRMIMYRGRTRITPQEGRTILAECELWVETCRHALAKAPARAEAPWRSLLQGGRIIGAQGETWVKVVDATLGTSSDSEWETVMVELIGFAELTREDVSRIIRTRADCDR
ncbi:TIP-1 family-domain-containing protein [Irpex rosettiformis]|uniref:TIP-1 family-domain-containing protein n=1 Tax=Irpex rosettiformis TaxID=378272 RepID=A0ACB8ULS5_9APHY|nr:TIP-1 family-domain-containing protein [Irpex rosettiformis]